MFATLGSNGRINVWSIAKSSSPKLLESVNIGDNSLPLKGAALKWSPYIADHFVCYAGEFIASFRYARKDSNYLLKRSDIDDVFFVPSGAFGNSFSSVDLMVSIRDQKKLSLLHHDNKTSKTVITPTELLITSPVLYYFKFTVASLILKAPMRLW